MLVTQSCLTLCDPMDCSPTGSSVHEIFPGKNTGVGSLSLLQEIFPTQGSNPGLPHCRQILYHLSHQGSPVIGFGFLCAWNSPGKNTGVSCHSLLQGIFPTQGLNSGLLHCRQTLYHLSHQGRFQRNKHKILLGKKKRRALRGLGRKFAVNRNVETDGHQ